MLKISCPKSKKHNKFYVSAHVVQIWKVDSSGEFAAVIDDCIDVLHFPDTDDVFTCIECGNQAIVKDMDD